MFPSAVDPTDALGFTVIRTGPNRSSSEIHTASKQAQVRINVESPSAAALSRFVARSTLDRRQIGPIQRAGQSSARGHAQISLFSTHICSFIFQPHATRPAKRLRRSIHGRPRLAPIVGSAQVDGVQTSKATHVDKCATTDTCASRSRL